MKRFLIYSALLIYVSLPLMATNPIVNDEFINADTTSKSIVDKQKNRVMIDAGFAHWTSDRFRTAILGSDFGFGISMNPGVKFLQVHARYDFATIRTTEGDTIYYAYNDKFAGFTALGLGLTTEFSKKNQTVVLSYSWDAVMLNIKSRDATFGMGADLGVCYLIKPPSWDRISMGVSFHVLSRTYNITDEKAKFYEWFSGKKEVLDRDTNIIMGVVVSF